MDPTNGLSCVGVVEFGSVTLECPSEAWHSSRANHKGVDCYSPLSTSGSVNMKSPDDRLARPTLAYRIPPSSETGSSGMDISSRGTIVLTCVG